MTQMRAAVGASRFEDGAFGHELHVALVIRVVGLVVGVPTYGVSGQSDES